MNYLVYLVADDESATILREPVYETDTLWTTVSDDIILEIVKDLLRTNGVTLPEDITTGTAALEWMREECIYYSENILAVVEDKNGIRESLEVVGKALLDTMGSDSSCYRAAASWRAVVLSHSVKSFKI